MTPYFAEDTTGDSVLRFYGRWVLRILALVAYTLIVAQVAMGYGA